MIRGTRRNFNKIKVCIDQKFSFFVFVVFSDDEQAKLEHSDLTDELVIQLKYKNEDKKLYYLSNILEYFYLQSIHSTESLILGVIYLFFNDLEYLQAFKIY